MKPSPNVPAVKPPIASPLRHAESRCQRAERLHLLGREQLAAALLAQCAAGANAEIEIVEDLVPGLVSHIAHCSLLRRCHRASFTCRTCISARGTGSTIRRSSGKSASSIEQVEPELVVASGDLTHDGRRDEHEAAARYLRALGRPLLVVPGNHDIPPWPPRTVHPPLAGVRAPVGDDDPRLTLADTAASSG